MNAGVKKKQTVLIIGVVAVVVMVLFYALTARRRLFGPDDFTIEIVDQKWQGQMARIIREADIIAEITIIEEPINKNSVIVNKNNKSQPPEYYTLVKAMVTDVIKGEDKLNPNSPVNIKLPIYIEKDGTVHQEPERRYGSLIHKGEKFTLFIKCRGSNGELHGKEGRAGFQLSRNLSLGYGCIVDLVLNCLDARNLDLELMAEAVYPYYFAEFSRMREIILETADERYLIFYFYMREENQTYFEIFPLVSKDSGPFKFIVGGNVELAD